MLRGRLLIVGTLWAFVAGSTFPAECSRLSAKQISLDRQSTNLLSSPDQRWRLLSVGTKSTEGEAVLYIQRTAGSRKWKIAGIERSGTAFWSNDSKRLFLRDEYAADDTRIRVFDLTGSAPKENKGLDARIREAIFAHVPKNKTTQWLYYPRVCFAAGDSSTIVLVADAPFVPRSGSGSGEAFSVRLSINLLTYMIDIAAPAQGERRPTDEEGTVGSVPVAYWHKIDTGAFTLLAPTGWEFHQLTGVDSYVGEFVGDGIALTFDFGEYSSGHYLDDARKPTYVITRKLVGGFSAKVVSPRIPGHGITGIYFQDVGASIQVCLFAKNLSASQQELLLKIFQTIRFRRPDAVQIPSVNPPPPKVASEPR